MADVPLRVTSGVVILDVGTLRVALDDGARVTPLWPAVWTPAEGDRVQLLIVDGVTIAIGPVAVAPRPLAGTVSGAASAGLIPVTTSIGTIQTRYSGTAPAIGTAVILLWHGSTPVLLPGALAPTVAPAIPTSPDAPVPPPVGPTSGTAPITALGSGSWQVGGDWTWPGTRVIQYRSGSAPENRGGWWYGDAPSVVAGRHITAARIRLGERLRIGSYNAAATLHLYLHANRTRPGGDWARTAGPVDVTLAANGPARWVDLPAGWGQAIADTGGGIAVMGAPYVGVAGTDSSDPASGQLALDWTA